MRVQPEPRAAAALNARIAVLLIAGHRMPGSTRRARGSGACGRSRASTSRSVARAPEELHRPKLRSPSALAAARHAHRALPADAGVGAQRRIDELVAQFPACPSPARGSASRTPPSRSSACRLRSAARLRATSRQPLVSRSSRCTSSSVSPRSQRAQRLDHAAAQPAPAVHRHARRLVEHQHRARPRGRSASARCARGARATPAVPGSTRSPSARAHRRHAHAVVRRAAAVSGSARLPLTRTSPLRITPEMRVRGTAGRRVCT